MVDDETLSKEKAALEAADGDIAELNGHLGALNEQLKTHANTNAYLHRRNEKIESLREHSGKFARIQDKLNRDRKELTEWEAKVAQIEGARHSQDACGCPACGVMLVNVNGELVEAKSMAVDPDTECQHGGYHFASGN